MGIVTWSEPITIPWGRSQSTAEELVSWFGENTTMLDWFTEDPAYNVGDSTSYPTACFWMPWGNTYIGHNFYGGTHTGSTSSTIGHSFVDPSSSEAMRKEWPSTSIFVNRMDSTKRTFRYKEGDTTKLKIFYVDYNDSTTAYNGQHDIMVIAKDKSFIWVANGASASNGPYYSYFAFSDYSGTYYNSKYKTNALAKNDNYRLTTQLIIQPLRLNGGKDYGIWTVDGGATLDTLTVTEEFSASGKNFMYLGAGLAVEL